MNSLQEQIDFVPGLPAAAIVPEREQDFIARLEALMPLLYQNSADLPCRSETNSGEVGSRGQALTKRCREQGLSVDEELIKQAALLHQAFGCLDYKTMGFESAKELSAQYAFQCLRFMGCSIAHALSVSQIVLAERAQAPCSQGGRS